MEEGIFSRSDELMDSLCLFPSDNIQLPIVEEVLFPNWTMLVQKKMKELRPRLEVLAQIEEKFGKNLFNLSTLFGFCIEDILCEWEPESVVKFEKYQLKSSRGNPITFPTLSMSFTVQLTKYEEISTMNQEFIHKVSCNMIEYVDHINYRTCPVDLSWLHE